MRRLLPFPVLGALLLGMWLLLNQSAEPAQVALGALVALIAVRGFAALRPPKVKLARVKLALELMVAVFVDVVRSNLAVATIVLRPGLRGRRAGFVEIPLQLRDPSALAILACIITATPGTAWMRYDATSGILTMHILDLVDEAMLVKTIQDRYERRLLGIFE